MTISSEQFNKLATKDDLGECATKDDLQTIKNQILGVADTVLKKLDDIEHAFVSNLAAHDRFEKRIIRIEKHLNLEPMFDCYQ